MMLHEHMYSITRPVRLAMVALLPYLKWLVLTFSITTVSWKTLSLEKTRGIHVCPSSTPLSLPSMPYGLTYLNYSFNLPYVSNDLLDWSEADGGAPLIKTKP